MDGSILWLLFTLACLLPLPATVLPDDEHASHMPYWWTADDA